MKLVVLKYIVSAGAFVTASAAAFSQQDAHYTKAGNAVVAVRIDSFLSSLNKNGNFNGNALVAKNGNLVYSNSFGYADIAGKKPNNKASRFQIASVSKIFTSTAVLQLKERDLLQLDDLFVKYFPSFPYANVTIRQMLSHTSGLPDYEIFETAIKDDPLKIFTNNDIIPALVAAKKPLRFVPGERWNYCNLNYCLLALLIEKLSGKPFAEYLEKNIFLPAKMTDTYLETGTKKISYDNRTINYCYPNYYLCGLQKADTINEFKWRTYSINGFAGQGNIITTTNDMLRFDKALYNESLLTDAVLNEAFTPVKLNNGGYNNADIGIGKASYGLGWFIFLDSSNGKIVWHGGGMPGAIAIFLRNITAKQTVILLDNTQSEGGYKNGVNVMNIINGNPIETVPTSLARKIGQEYFTHGAASAVDLLNELKLNNAYRIKAPEIDELAYNLLDAGDTKTALAIFIFNTQQFPGSEIVWEDLGEAYYKMGDKQKALENYEKSLQINPGNDDAKKMKEKIKAETAN